MTSSNRVQVAAVAETTPGTTPASPRMRTVRITGESLAFRPEYITSDEIRSDRMVSDPILAMKSSEGGINSEVSYPVDESPLSMFLSSALQNPWSNTPQRFNDGTADSVITDVAANGVITVTTGAAFAVGHLVQMSGFTNSGNNRIARITTGSATVPSVGAGLLTAEAVPPGTARVKVVGFQGASGDIVAVSTGLTSTALDFTTLGLVVGAAIKIGGTAAGDKFATAANNVYCRVAAIAANALTLDNLPADWAADVGTGKTIKVWFGDRLVNGVTPLSMTIEKGYLAQAVPTYIAMRGMQVGSVALSASSKGKITANFSFSGLSGAADTASVAASLEAATSARVMTSNANIARLTEGGQPLATGSCARSIEFTVNNNLAMIECLASVSPVGIRAGECSVTGKADFYFGSKAILDKFYAGTPSSLFMPIQQDNQAIVINLPRVTYTGGGNPAAGGKNQDVMLPLDFQASKDAATGVQISISRFEYVE